MSTTIEHAPDRQATKVPLVHYCKSDDRDTALCGTPLRRDAPSRAVECLVCAELIELEQHA